jgi:gas vesicle protein
MSNTFGNVGWFATGVVMGVAVAVLYAPKSGKDTRNLIGKKGDENLGALGDSSKDLLEKGRELYERGRQIAEEAAELFERGRELVRG